MVCVTENKKLFMTVYNEIDYDGRVLRSAECLAKKYDIIATHDVDMLPDNYLLQYYLHIPKHPLHIAHPGSSVKYSYDKYIGGINVYSAKQYKKLNGFPNTFWGWGGEDDALYERITANNMLIVRPNKGKIKELEHKSFHKQKEYTNTKKWENRVHDVKHWKKNGLSNLEYNVTSVKKSRWYTIINV